MTATVNDFEEVVHAYERTLYGLARSIVRNPQDAEEVVQDAFVRAHRALSRMSSSERVDLHLKAWLYVITRNSALNRLRKKRPVLVSLDAVENPENALQHIPTNASPELIVEELQSRQLIENALLCVPERWRGTAKLRFVDGLSHAEIAERFDQPIGTVKSHLHRAVVVLRRVLRAQLQAA
jgi:RNA polymerase sigma-70 factor, ECF subfamily